MRAVRHHLTCAIVQLGLALSLSLTPAIGAAGILTLDAPIPTEIPPGTKLVIGDPIVQRALEISGEIKKLPFQVEWAHISGGPGTLEAFQAKALDIGSAADIPPIHAIWIGIPVKIIAVRFRKDPLNHPGYKIGIAPGARIDTLADLEGKKIAYSPGQAQGAVVLRTLAQAGIDKRRVTLVELPATSDVYNNALGSHLVDAAPIGGIAIKRYLEAYGRDGAKVLDHSEFRDDPSNLWVRTETLRDPVKAAAIKEYIKFWARAAEWVRTHREEWIQKYYVRDQGISEEDARYLIDISGDYDIPGQWDDVVKREQETVDFMAKETGNPKFDAADLFDRRFESVATDAITAYKAVAAGNSNREKHLQ
jgi:sulfonate transport system substrate-binding protein